MLGPSLKSSGVVFRKGRVREALSRSSGTSSWRGLLLPFQMVPQALRPVPSNIDFSEPFSDLRDDRDTHLGPTLVNLVRETRDVILPLRR